MITKEEIFRIGKILKPHGLQGELAFSFDTDVFDEVENPYFICKIDGIFVPFFIESYRFKTDETALVKFEGIGNETEAKELANADLYMSRKFLPKNDDPEDYSLYVDDINFYIGYRILDKDGNQIGKIIDYDDATENVLFVVETLDKNEILIPAQDDLIVLIDDNKQSITMDLPEGLIDLDNAEEE